MTAANLSKDTTPVDGAAAVRVTVMAGDTKVIPFGSDLTVADYLQKADVTVAGGTVVTVNGAPANQEGTVEAGSVLVVADKVING